MSQVKKSFGVLAAAVALFGGIHWPRRKRRAELELADKEESFDREKTRLLAELRGEASVEIAGDSESQRVRLRLEKGAAASCGPAGIARRGGARAPANDVAGRGGFAERAERRQLAELERAACAARAGRVPVKAQDWGQGRRSRRRWRHKAACT